MCWSTTWCVLYLLVWLLPRSTTMVRYIYFWLQILFYTLYAKMRCCICFNIKTIEHMAGPLCFYAKNTSIVDNEQTLSWWQVRDRKYVYVEMTKKRFLVSQFKCVFETTAILLKTKNILMINESRFWSTSFNILPNKPNYSNVDPQCLSR